MTMTLADQAARTGQDGQVTDKRASRPVRRTFTAAYKARILAAYDALPEGSPERGALMRRERLYHSHIEHWRKQQENGTLASSTGKPNKDTESEELARLRAENKKLKAEAAKLEAKNDKLASELGKTKTALDIAGKAFALLDDISRSADSGES
ncbi:transposase [Microbispora siamensis]